MNQRFAALLFSIVFASSVHVLNACISPALLGNMGFQPGSTITYRFYGGWGTETVCVKNAIAKWEAAAAAVGLNLDFVETTGSPDMTLTKTSLPGSTVGATTAPSLDSQGYTVGIGLQFTTNTNLLSTCDGFIKVALHEIGHALGLADTYGSGGSSVMNQLSGANDSGGNIPLDVTSCDRNRADLAAPSDPCDWGCPPGYRSWCEGDQQPDPAHCNCCVDYTPIILDLGDDDFHFSSAEEGVRFAINSRGTTVRLSWPIKPDDMWLVHDVNQNGNVDDGSELFGNTTVLRAGGFAKHGYDALQDFDRNRDGVVDAEDRGFRRLLLWSDANRNGFSEPNELQSLEQAGVTSLSMDFRESRRTDRWGNKFKYFSTATIRGRRASILTVDVYPMSCPY